MIKKVLENPVRRPGDYLWITANVNSKNEVYLLRSA